MPTPPIRRRNPAVSIRRVQSERKYLSPWGSVAPCPIWKPQFEYARKTAIIPPLSTDLFGTAVGARPHMLGTSQGVLGCHFSRGVPNLHPYLQEPPLILVVPPLFARGYSSPNYEGRLNEGEFLAQERIASFLTEGSSTHKPMSLLSYSESHLYESLISQLSDLNADDISIESSKIESDYLHIDSFPNGSTTRSKVNKSLTSLSSTEEGNDECRNQYVKSKCTDTKDISPQIGRNLKENSLENICHSDKLRKISFSERKLLDKYDKTQRTKIPNGISDNPPSNDHAFLGIKKEVPLNVKKHDLKKSYITKPILSLKDKKEQKNVSLLRPTQTVVSLVHVNKENGIDEVTFRESTCYKCCNNSEFSQLTNSNRNEITNAGKYSSHANRGSNENRQKSEGSQVSSKPCKKDCNACNWRSNETVPRTIELSESEPSSRQNSNVLISEVILKNDPTSASFCSFESVSSKDSTLDPLKPSFVEKKREPLVPKILTKNIGSDCSHTKNTKDQQKRLQLKNAATNVPSKEKHSKDIGSDLIPPLTINFYSEDSSSDTEIFTIGHRNPLSLTYADDEDDDTWSKYSSVLEVYSIATTKPDSFVYMYKSPAKSYSSDSSSRRSSLSHRFTDNVRKGSINEINRTNESSGLGSSGSDNSFDDISLQLRSSSGGSSLNRTTLESSNKSSVTFLEPSFRPAKHISSTPSSSCGRLSFDYSCSWTDLNNLVKKSSSFGCFKQAKVRYQSPSRKFLTQDEICNFSSATYTKKALAL